MGSYRGPHLGDIHRTEEKPMPRVVVALVLIGVAGATLSGPLLAQKPSTPPATGARVNACTILPREEVKKIFPWDVPRELDEDTELPFGGGSA